MFAIIETGGKQYRAEKGSVLRIEKLPEEEGDQVIFDRVYLVCDGTKAEIGMPYVEGARVTGVIKAQDRAEKIRVVKFQAKKRVKKIQGHRQCFTEVEVTDIASAPAKKVAPAVAKTEVKAEAE